MSAAHHTLHKMNRVAQLIHYSARCVVVKTDDPVAIENMERMGAKTNFRLTDRESGEKFTGYIFPKNREAEVKSWLSTGKVSPDAFKERRGAVPARPGDAGLIQELLRRVSALESEVERLKRSRAAPSRAAPSAPPPRAPVLAPEDEDRDEAPMRRLL